MVISRGQWPLFSFARNPAVFTLGDGSRPKSISGSGRCGCGNRPDFKKLKISLDFFVSFLVNAKKRREKK